MKKLLPGLGLAALLILIPGLCSADPAESSSSDPPCGEEVLASLFAPEAVASSPPALEVQGLGECCAREFAKCVKRCGECGVARFDCTLDFPGCTPRCTCNRCP